MPTTRSPTRAEQNRQAVLNMRGGNESNEGHGYENGVGGGRGVGVGSRIQDDGPALDWTAEGEKATKVTRNIALLAKEIKKMADNMLPNTKLELRKGIEISMELIKKITRDGSEVVVMDREERAKDKTRTED
uniref:Uncharacterized protein n=1 Tax=Cacopsylla melanoneura TaxID=428564 RepID=A0A8D8RJ38_9HEMI